MKQIWKKRSALFCMIAVLLTAVVPAIPVAAEEAAAAETTVTNGWDANKTHYYQNGKAVTGLKKIKGSYYYFTNKGKVVKNKLKKVKQGSKTYTFYFGKNGAAYKAAADKFTVNCKVCKINGKYYGFDAKSHAVTGIWAGTNGKIYAFGKNGAMNAEKTKKLRAIGKVGKKSRTLLADVKKAYGKPKKERIEKNSCNPFAGGKTSDYHDYILTYDNVEVQMTKNIRTGVYHMNGAGGRDK